VAAQGANRMTSTAGNLKLEVSDFKRRRIREEACALFFARGYESTTLDAVAHQLDVTKPFIYSYYATKSDLLYDICRLGISMSLEALQHAASLQRSPSERLQIIVESVLAIIFEYRKFIVVYEREEKNLERAKAREIRELRKLFDHQLADMLVDGNRRGEFDIIDPVLTATTIGGMITWVAQWYSPDGKRTQLEVVNHTLLMVGAVVHARDGHHAGAIDFKKLAVLKQPPLKPSKKES
jgi:AcrR family transcriptional regulator